MNSNEIDQEEVIFEAILKDSISQCIKCVMWDKAATIYGKKGMRQDCFNKTYVLINTKKQHEREF